MNIPTDLSSCIRRWTNLLRPVSDTPRLDTEILVKHVSGLDDVGLIVDSKRELDEQIISRIDQLIEERIQGTPIAYLVGEREFYALSLKLNHRILIPRPETELLVDSALEIIASLASPAILDLGTGSGAIAIAIAAHAPQAEIIACDKEQHAVDLASENARRHQLGNVRFMTSDWFTALGGQQFDLIVSNPPYVQANDPHLEQGDVRFEPKSALVSGEDGLDDIRQIIRHAREYLVPGGHILLEHGYDQGTKVRKLLQQAGFCRISTRRDLNRVERVTMGQVMPPESLAQAVS